MPAISCSRGRGGLVPFGVDVHATRRGTLTRLVHVVAGGLVAEGVAFDEGTCVEVPAGGSAGELRVHGLGSAYRVQRGAGGEVSVTPLTHGSRPASWSPGDQNAGQRPARDAPSLDAAVRAAPAARYAGGVPLEAH